ncbi:hypothetical protein [Microbacterium sp. KR10-403]|uniref:hypothetical protein n=1 Tax=Microbacterium sp. KR10-403 TaxID=3158581 RepID=UPI0032E3F1E3
MDDLRDAVARWVNVDTTHPDGEPWAPPGALRVMSAYAPFHAMCVAPRGRGVAVVTITPYTPTLRVLYRACTPGTEHRPAWADTFENAAVLAAGRGAPCRVVSALVEPGRLIGRITYPFDGNVSEYIIDAENLRWEAVDVD